MKNCDICKKKINQKINNIDIHEECLPGLPFSSWEICGNIQYCCAECRMKIIISLKKAFSEMVEKIKKEE